MNVLKIYKNLLAEFGSQGWWPIFDIKTKKCQYHTIGSPAPDSQKFEICVGAILTQNTAWKNVEKALYNLSLRGVYSLRGNPVKNITPQTILNHKNLEHIIKPAGYYNQKAKKLRIFSEWWVFNYNRIAAPEYELAMTDVRSELLDLWGIGPETADSILLYAFNQPIFVIDTYTKRLCKEFGIEFKTYEEYQNFFENTLPRNPKLFNEYHALIVAWGKLYSKNKEKAIKVIRSKK